MCSSTKQAAPTRPTSPPTAHKTHHITPPLVSPPSHIESAPPPSPRPPHSLPRALPQEPAAALGACALRPRHPSCAAARAGSPAPLALAASAAAAAAVASPCSQASGKAPEHRQKHVSRARPRVEVNSVPPVRQLTHTGQSATGGTCNLQQPRTCRCSLPQYLPCQQQSGRLPAGAASPL